MNAILKISADPTLTNPHGLSTEQTQWLIEQTKTGQSPADLLSALQVFGWQEDAAIEALEYVLTDYLQAAAPGDALEEPVPLQVPEPAQHDSSLWLDVGDKQVRIAMQMKLPRVLLVDDFLSDEECQAVITLAQQRLNRSLVLDDKTGQDVVDDYRTSDGMFLDQAQTPTIQSIEARIGRLLNWPVEKAEGLQVLRYRPGTQYLPHHDYFDPDTPGGASIIKNKGQRVATLLMYLNEPTKGGSTSFPDVGLEVAPRKGSALFFSYDLPNPSTRTLHAGMPVIEGEKWVATKWLLAVEEPAAAA